MFLLQAAECANCGFNSGGRQFPNLFFCVGERVAMGFLKLEEGANNAFFHGLLCCAVEFLHAVQAIAAQGAHARYHGWIAVEHVEENTVGDAE